MKAKPCYLIMNTRWGYCMQPIWFSSIKKAKEYADECGMAYRIILDKSEKK